MVASIVDTPLGLNADSRKQRASPVIFTHTEKTFYIETRETSVGIVDVTPV